MTDDPKTRSTLPPVTISWPARALWPNGQGHFMALARARRKQKGETFGACVSAGLHLIRIPPGSSVRLHWVFCPTSRTRTYDDDNAEAAMKAARDQIAAVLGIDDRHFTATRERGERCKDGAVIAMIEVVTG